MPLTVPTVNPSPGFQKGKKFGRQCYYRGYQMYTRSASIRGILRHPNMSRTTFKLPSEIFWPAPYDWDGVKGYVDALCDGDMIAIEEIEKEHPDFRFTHDEYVLELRAAIIERGPSPHATVSLIPPSIIPSKAREKIRSQLCERTTAAGIVVTLDMVYWDAGATTLELTCRYQSQVLTKVAIGTSGDYAVIEHRLGRYRILGLDPNTYRRFLTVALPTSRLSKGAGGSGTVVPACPASPPSTAASMPSEPSSAKTDLSSKSLSDTGGSPSPLPGPSTTN